MNYDSESIIYSRTKCGKTNYMSYICKHVTSTADGFNAVAILIIENFMLCDLVLVFITVIVHLFCEIASLNNYIIMHFL